MPGKIGPLPRKRTARFSRISSFTVRRLTRSAENWWLLRSSARVWGKLLKGWVPPGSVPLLPRGPHRYECSYSTPATITRWGDAGHPTTVQASLQPRVLTIRGPTLAQRFKPEIGGEGRNGLRLFRNVRVENVEKPIRF